MWGRGVPGTARRGAGWLATAAAAALIAPAGAGADIVGTTCTGFVCEGSTSADHSLTFERLRTDRGGTVKAVGVGDMNGDDAEEITVTVPSDYTEDNERAVLVVDGRATGSPPSGDQIEMRVVDGVTGTFGQAVGVADVNGDGVDEIAVATGTHIVVVFGRVNGSTVDLRQLGDDGFRIRDASLGPGSGGSDYGAWPDVLSPGDLDGDGRGEVAYRQGNTVRVVFPGADAPGKNFDTAAAGPRVAILRAPGEFYENANLDEPGDLNGDGTPDLAIFARSPTGGTDAFGVMQVAPGDDVDLSTLAESGDGWELHSDGTSAADDFAWVVGDHNRDGRRDVALPGADAPFIAYSPPAGTERSFGPLAPGEATQPGVGRWSLGDIDGDGIDETGGNGRMYTSDTSDPADPTGTGWTETPGRTWLYNQTTVDMLADENGDGAPEELTTYRDPETGDSFVRTFFARPFIRLDPVTAVDRQSIFEFQGSLEPTPENRARLGGAITAAVIFYVGGRSRGASYGGYWDRESGEIRGLNMPAAFIPHENGAPVSFRVELQRDNRPLARGPLQDLSDAVIGEPIIWDQPVTEPPADPEAPTTGPLPPSAPNRITGTGKRDRLIGTEASDLIEAGAGRDRVQGRSADDLLRGGPGSDVISGASGSDQLVGGPGRDVLRCGAGDDVAVTDGDDRIVGCEHRVRTTG